MSSGFLWTQWHEPMLKMLRYISSQQASSATTFDEMGRKEFFVSFIFK